MLKGVNGRFGPEVGGAGQEVGTEAGKLGWLRNVEDLAGFTEKSGPDPVGSGEPLKGSSSGTGRPDLYFRKLTQVGHGGWGQN